MIRNVPFWRTTRLAAAILVVLVSLFGTSPALAAGDRKPPTKPANLRVTSLTPHRVTLAWDPSTDNSGTFTYRVFVSWGSTTTLPQTQTTYSVGLVPANTYSFYVYAVDGSGNRSQSSNTLTVTTPPDTTPPSPPVVSLAGVNPTEVSLRWTASTDDGLHIRYQVFVNGSPSGVETLNGLAAVVHGLTPETTYEITVKAQDFYGGNVSAPSNVLTVTTPAVSATDTESPSAPGCCGGGDVGGLELNIFWGLSFDNQTPQASIAYEIYLNGVWDHTTSGDRAVVYVTQTGDNTITLIAVDDAGNRSEPSSMTFFVQ
ncbi:MAG TPA: fibronectin type III domain-containing protein [Anaerolineales bacterium]|nr:fibronectin type III domain-containing protein [Anaerolineales bacterium]